MQRCGLATEAQGGDTVSCWDVLQQRLAHVFGKVLTDPEFIEVPDQARAPGPPNAGPDGSSRHEPPKSGTGWARSRLFPAARSLTYVSVAISAEELPGGHLAPATALRLDTSLAQEGKRARKDFHALAVLRKASGPSGAFLFLVRGKQIS
eukprot:CAMPEP_0202094350 /NCGR_PEP_ID=MMETSP0964-20121228/49001_1 /ASSEMBLY_ACC=CAM_ASM_000500 /TAXON_ID=4773 /ORGANISM="Schizochytrium aggregatum, Strain ATCC28209" /LENGTH=149 /DNA_ID=CAMNT_0048662607 /DNA_START=1312 /DNA_END=1759 /DNA_ORIENTATION=-